MKKFFAMVMAGVMTMGMGVTAFAEGENKMEVTGTTAAPILKMTIPTTSTLVVNPYKLSVDDPDDDGDEKINSQIISPVKYIYSSSNVPVTANVTVTGSVKGGATFATADPTTASKPSTKKDVYLYAQVSDVKDLGAAVTGTPATDDAAAAALGLTFGEAYSSTADVLVGAKAVTKAGMFKMAPATFGEDGTTVEDAKVIGFRLAGTANDKSPTAWTADDSVDVAITFDFVPGAVEEEAP